MEPTRASCSVFIALMTACSGLGLEVRSEVESLPFSAVGMVEIPGGPYHYDCNEEVFDDCDTDELPGSTRTLSTFYIDRTEVTVAEYRECVEAGACTDEGLGMPYWQYGDQPQWAWACNWNYTDHELHPINCVDFEMASSYCKWRGKRLPSQGEWQKAARGTDGRMYPWGNRRYSRTRQLANVADETYKRFDPLWKIAWGYDDGYLATAPVGSFPQGASPYGVLDMAGNVWEWTSSHPIDEQGEEVEDRRWMNGGAFDSRPAIVRVTYHFSTRPMSRFPNTGMRCAH